MVLGETCPKCLKNEEKGKRTIRLINRINDQYIRRQENNKRKSNNNGNVSTESSKLFKSFVVGDVLVTSRIIHNSMTENINLYSITNLHLC